MIMDPLPRFTRLAAGARARRAVACLGFLLAAWPVLAQPSPAPAEGATGAVLAPPQRPPNRTRVFVHYSSLDPSGLARAEEVAGALRAAGYEVVALRGVPFGVSRRQLRCYYEADLPLCDRMAALLDQVPGQKGRPSWGVRDFRGYPTPPAPRVVEVWLPSP
jgi:hypothetical protein